MKKIIFLVLALLVLAGAGVGGFLLFGPKQGEGEQEVVEEKPPEPQGDPSFVKIDPLIVPVIGEKRVEQNIVLEFALEVYGDAVRDQVQQIKPRLVDAYLRVLYGGIESRELMVGKSVDMTKLKARLMEATEKVVGPHVVHDVLIQSVSQRPVQ